MPFNAETAVIAARKSHEPTSARYAPKPAKVSACESRELLGDPACDDADKFRDEAKLRAREHITKLQSRIDDMLDRRELDVKAMRDLADAVLKLESVEQRLSGRPLPGTLKPSSKPAKRQQSSYPEPVPCEAPPVQVDQAKPAAQVATGDWATMLF